MTKQSSRVLKKSSSRGSKLAPRLSAEQWDAPAGFCAHEIRRATLREVLDPNIPTKNIAELSIPELYDLASARVKLLPSDFQVAIMGYGLIDKQRALAEVQGRTPLGKHIAILQIKVLQHEARLGQHEMAPVKKL
jgi:hypothetical protein